MLVALIISFSAGRWAAPTKVVTEIKTVEVEKKTEQTETDKNKHKKVTITETTSPDGTKKKVTTISEDTQTDTKTAETDQIDKETDKTKTVERARDKVTISLLGGVRFGEALSSGAVVYGGEISKPLLGPIRLGIFGLTSGVVGISLGLDL